MGGWGTAILGSREESILAFLAWRRAPWTRQWGGLRARPGEHEQRGSEDYEPETEGAGEDGREQAAMAGAEAPDSVKL